MSWTIWLIPLHQVRLPLPSTTFSHLDENTFASTAALGFGLTVFLAKHLRTKNHVKTLQQQNKLPDDALALFKDNPSHLANVDATNCEQAKLSLISGSLQQ